MAGNNLIGTLPSSLLSLPHLFFLNVSANNFLGHTEELFLRFSGSPLTVVDMSHNAFSGSLSHSLFLHDKLTAVRLSDNCISGSLPDSLCSAVNLTVLALDGVGSASVCSKSYGPLFKIKTYSRSLHGTIPDCVWRLPRLSVLFLPGNQLSGTLGDIPGDSNSLRHRNLLLQYQYQ